MKKTKQKITKTMTISEVVSKYPETMPVLMKYGMYCVGCPMAVQESLEDGLSSHGINIDKIIDELNRKIKKRK